MPEHMANYFKMSDHFIWGKLVLKQHVFACSLNLQVPDHQKIIHDHSVVKLLVFKVKSVLSWLNHNEIPGFKSHVTFNPSQNTPGHAIQPPNLQPVLLPPGDRLAI